MSYHKTRAELSSAYLEARALTVEICSSLTDEDNNLQVSADCSPNKWHLGHTTWFFESFVLSKYQQNHSYYNQNWLYFLNSYYENKGRRILKSDRHKISRPRFSEILNYRKIIDNSILELLAKTDDDNLLFLIDLGINHEQQHQELMLQDIKLNFFNGLQETSFRLRNNKISHKKAEGWLNFAEGIYEFGAGDDSFFYDNEKGKHKRYLHDFRLAKRLVTNGEYLEFINDGGYRDPNFWLSDGWEWINANEINKPLYWIEESSNLFEYTLNGMSDLDLDKPVSHISYYEAWAYARYKNKRLPTEFELELAAKTHKAKEPNLLDEIRVSILEPIGRENARFIGDAWEWTSSPYVSYPFYKQDPGAFGEYNGKFMNGLYVLKGGSSLTPRKHIRNTYRNFYSPEKRWVQSGFRLAEHI